MSDRFAYKWSPPARREDVDWHRRLGHVSVGQVRVYDQLVPLRNESLCTSLGLYVRSPFSWHQENIYEHLAIYTIRHALPRHLKPGYYTYLIMNLPLYDCKYLTYCFIIFPSLIFWFLASVLCNLRPWPTLNEFPEIYVIGVQYNGIV